jgi:cytochrome c oxidase subunit IV
MSAHAHEEAHGHAAPHDPEERAHHRRDYVKIFIALGVLTAIEVGITKVPMPRNIFMVLMIGLAVTKAALVGLYFMHLKYEKRSLLWLAAVPFPLAGLYALLLMLDAQGVLRAITLPWK